MSYRHLSSVRATIKMSDNIRDADMERLYGIGEQLRKNYATQRVVQQYGQDILESAEQTNETLLKKLQNFQQEQIRHNENVTTTLLFLADSMVWLTKNCVTRNELHATSALNRKKIIQAHRNTTRGRWPINDSENAARRENDHPLEILTESELPSEVPTVLWDNIVPKPAAYLHCKYSYSLSLTFFAVNILSLFHGKYYAL